MGSRRRTVEHIGEWKLLLWADAPAEVFIEAARALAERAGPRLGERSEWQPIRLQARDRAGLLVDWLNELIFLGETRGVAVEEVADLQLTETTLQCRVRGARLREWRSPAKAATFHDLRFEPTAQGWRASVILDV